MTKLQDYYVALNSKLPLAGVHYPVDKGGAEWKFVKYCFKKQIDLMSAAHTISNQRASRDSKTFLDGVLHACWNI